MPYLTISKASAIALLCAVTLTVTGCSARQPATTQTVAPETTANKDAGLFTDRFNLCITNIGAEPIIFAWTGAADEQDKELPAEETSIAPGAETCGFARDEIIKYVASFTSNGRSCFATYNLVTDYTGSEFLAINPNSSGSGKVTANLPGSAPGNPRIVCNGLTAEDQGVLWMPLANKEQTAGSIFSSEVGAPWTVFWGTELSQYPLGEAVNVELKIG